MNKKHLKQDKKVIVWKVGKRNFIITNKGIKEVEVLK